MTSFEQSYDEAVASGRLPGVALMATDKTGTVDSLSSTAVTYNMSRKLHVLQDYRCPFIER